MISSKLRGLMFSRRRWARTDAWRRLVLVVALVATTSQLVPSSAWSFSTAPVYSHERRRETRIRNGLQFRLHQSNDPSSGSSAEPEEGSPTTSLSPAPAPPPPPQTPLDDKDADPFSFLPAPFLTSEQSEVTFVDFTEDGACVPAGPIGQAKETLANFMDEPIVELTVASVVLVSSLLVAISTLSAMEPYLDTIKMVQTGVGIIFFLDFISRWFSSPKDAGKFILDAFFFVDILVVVLPLAVALTPDSFWAETPLPDWATSPSGLFNLQLFRVLRLRRVLKDISTFEKFQRALPGSGVLSGVQEWQLQLARVLLSLFTLVSVATGLIYTVEHDSNPAISDYFTALYFGLTTLTTVGFGDIVPVTTAGKLVVCGSIIAGVAVVPAQAAALVEALLQRQDLKKSAASQRPGRSSIRGDASLNGTSGSKFELDTGTVCSNCGATMHWASADYCYKCGDRL